LTLILKDNFKGN